MMILGIDTSTEMCALGLMTDEEIIGEININLHRRHSARLMPNIKSLFQETDREITNIEGLAVTRGPGSYTGLRIGLSTVKAFAQYLKVPVIGLSTLEVLAYNSEPSAHKVIAPMLDARGKRVYTALFQSAEASGNSNKFKGHYWKRVWEDQILEIPELINNLIEFSRDKTYYLTGNGVNAYRGELLATELNCSYLPVSQRKPRGANVAEVGAKYLKEGRQSSLPELLPNYLRKPQAEVNWRQKYNS